MNFLWILFEMTVNVFQATICSGFIWKVLSSKYTGLKNTAFFISCILTQVIALIISNYYVAYDGIAIFVYYFMYFIFALTALNGSFIKKLLISLIPISCITISNIFGTNLTSLIFNQPIMDLLSQNSFYRIFVVVLVNIILFALLYILQNIFIKSEINLTKYEWILIGLVFSISIIIFVSLYFTIFEGVSSKSKIYIALAVMLVIVINLIVYSLLVQLSKKHKIELEHNLLMQQYSFQKQSAIEVKSQYEQLQKIRHDYNNGLRVIQALNSENKTKEIDDYIEKYLDSQNNTIHIVSTKNEYVNAIINSKTAQANSNNIKVEINVISDIEYTNNLDFCNILGNMFDNAIEACNKCKKNKLIQLNISKDNDSITIFMKNSIPVSVINNNPELKTDKKDKSKHGYGTKIIRELAEKHHGFADFYEQDNMFCCNVILYNK